MKGTFPRVLAYLGIPFVTVAWILAVRLIWEQTVWSWKGGPQMVGYSLMHSGPGILLVLVFYAGVLWAAVTLITAAIKRSLGGRLTAALLAAYVLAWAVIATPYGFWQRMFIDQFTPEQAADFFVYAAATGDRRTVKAFLNRGIDINIQGEHGTALHGAAVEGEIEVIELLLVKGADVNAINAYGDTPLANAMQAKNRALETQELLKRHGAQEIRGSEEHRNRVIEEQVRRQIEEMEQWSKE